MRVHAKNIFAFSGAGDLDTPDTVRTDPPTKGESVHARASRRFLQTQITCVRNQWLALSHYDGTGRNVERSRSGVEKLFQVPLFPPSSGIFILLRFRAIEYVERYVVRLACCGENS